MGCPTTSSYANRRCIVEIPELSKSGCLLAWPPGRGGLPFCVDIATEKGSEPEVGRRLFQELADTGRFRVVLWLDGVCERSTHLPCEDC